MNRQTIAQLNQLNRQFYQTVADDFDKTRQQPWEGWDELKSLWAELKTPHIWDLGCGNGRFAVYLQKNNPGSTYVGFDNSVELLTKAHQQLPGVTFSQLDLVTSWLEGTLAQQLPAKKADLIVMFGVIHHLPSEALRQEILKELAKHLNPGGVMVVAAWQFLNDQNLKKRLVEPKKVHVSPAELESNDYILDWKRGTPAYRYCHQVSPAEAKQLASASGLKLEKQFTADGKEGNLNLYLVLRKK